MKNIDDLEACPRCNGSGGDPIPAPPLKLVAVTAPNERIFELNPNRCRLCGGSGRIPKRRG